MTQAATKLFAKTIFVFVLWMSAVVSAQTTTIDKLQGTAALSAYIEASLDKNTACEIPPGKIEFAETLVIDFIQGGRIEGAGQPCASASSPLGWNFVNRDKSTRLVYTGPADKPAVILRGVQNLKISDLSIEHANKGTAVLYPHFDGWGSSGLTLEDVSFFDCAVGFQAGETGNDHNAADVRFVSCSWDKVDRCLVVKHDQGLNYHFLSCSANYCDTLAHCERGGFVTVRDCYTYGLKCLLRLDAGGINTAPSVIDGCRLDRNPGNDPLCCVVDATRAGGFVSVKVENCGQTVAPKEAKGFAYFRLPKTKQTWQKISVSNFCADGLGLTRPVNVAPAP